MFLMALVFSFVLLLTFGIVILAIRPSQFERAVQGRMQQISAVREAGPVAAGGGTDLIKSVRLSAISWIDRWLQDWGRAQAISQMIAQADSRCSVGNVLAGCGAVAAAGFGLSYYALGNWQLAAGAAVLCAGLPFLWLRLQAARRLKEFNRNLPEAIDLMSRALRAGHSVTAAIEIVGEESPEPVRSEFREVYRQQNFGLPAREALLRLAQRVPLPELNFVVTAMLLQKETGGNLVEVLDRTTAVIRERLRIQGEIRIYTAQGRLTGWILSLLPVAMFFLLSLANPGYTRVLIDDAAGRKLVYTGLTLMAVGGLAIRKIVNIKV